MADTDLQLIDEIRSMGQYREEELSDQEIVASIDRAKSDLVTEIPEDNPDWFADQAYTNALFWSTMLNTKIQAGALGSKSMSAGELDEEVLLAAADGEVTQWYRKYEKALNRLIGKKSGSRITSSARTSRDGNRHYSQPDLE